MMEPNQLYGQIYNLKEKLGKLQSEYWNMTSGIDTWYFWFNILFFLIPLIILYILIDRKRIFEVSFYGYSVHMIASKLNTALEAGNYLVHPHDLTAKVPGITITAVVLPVTYMLIYQYCTNRHKNFYFYAFLLSLAIAYLMDSFFIAIDYLRLDKGMNLTYLLFIDFAVACFAYWLTNFFKWMKRQKKGK